MECRKNSSMEYGKEAWQRPYRATSTARLVPTAVSRNFCHFLNVCLFCLCLPLQTVTVIWSTCFLVKLYQWSSLICFLLQYWCFVVAISIDPSDISKPHLCRALFCRGSAPDASANNVCIMHTHTFFSICFSDFYLSPGFTCSVFVLIVRISSTSHHVHICWIVVDMQWGLIFLGTNHSCLTRFFSVAHAWSSGIFLL